MAIFYSRWLHYLLFSVFIVVLICLQGCGGSDTSKTNPIPPPAPPIYETPVITHVSPAKQMIADNADHGIGSYLTIIGKYFNPDAVVLLDGKPMLETDFIDNSHLSAEIYSINMLTPGVHQVQVQTRGMISQAASYEIYYATHGPQPFNAAEGLNYPSYSYIREIGVGDFDGDGTGEIFAYSFNPYPNEFLIFKKEANGELKVINHFATPYTFDFALTGDINGDGFSDVVLVKDFNWGRGIVILTNDGKGNLQETSTLDFWGEVGRFLLEDVTSDGKKDLLIYESASCSLYLATNTGGYFSAPIRIVNGSGISCSYPDSTPLSFTTGDFNGDGKKDVIYSSHDAVSNISEFKILLQQDVSIFKESALNLTGLTAFTADVTETVTAIDFNKDGLSDLAVQSNDPSTGISLNVYKNNGDGTFTLVSSSIIAQPPNPSTYRLAAGDFDQDGNLDMVGYKEIGIWSETADNSVLYLWGNGTGGFVPEKILDSAVSSLTTGDVDRDGLTDVVIGNINGMVSVLPGSKTRNLPQPSYLSPNSGGQISAADVNGDGYLDLMVSDDAHSAPGMIYLNDGHGHFSQGISVPATARIIADLNGDGKAELIGGDDSGLLVWSGTGDPTYPVTPIRMATPYPPDQLKVLDINQDGRMDIISVNESKSSMILYALGNMTFNVSIEAPQYNSYVFGDFNRDGYLDYIDGRFLNLGNVNGIIGYNRYDLGNTLDAQMYKPLIAADFNKDGILDLASASQIFYGFGDGTFFKQGFLDNYIGGNIVTSDFNGDGIPDIIRSNSDSSATVYINDGQGRFQRSYISTGITGKYMIQADFNNDSKPDLAISGDKAAVVILNNYSDSNKASAFKELSTKTFSWIPGISTQHVPSKSNQNGATFNNVQMPVTIQQIGTKNKSLYAQEKKQISERQREIHNAAIQNLMNVYTPRVGSKLTSLPAAVDLAELLNKTGIIQASPITHPLLMKTSRKPAKEEKELWDLAHEFQYYVKHNPISGNYALYVDYYFNSKNWKLGHVNFILCDKKGELVVVDTQNAKHPDYQNVKPASIADCNALLVKRLKYFFH